MRILEARRLRKEPSPGGMRPICRFNYEPIEGVVIFDCSLVEMPGGRVLVYGPAPKHGGSTLSMAPDVRREVISRALQAAGIDNDEYRNKA